MTNPYEPIDPDTDPPPVRQWGLSWIRTVVPLLWGFLLTFLATRSPVIHELLADPKVYAAVEGVITAAWYGFFRAVEARLPAWLTRFVLGANTAPVYPAANQVR